MGRTSCAEAELDVSTPTARGCASTGTGSPSVGLGELGFPHHSHAVGAPDAGRRDRPHPLGMGSPLLWWHEGQGCPFGGKTPPARLPSAGKAGPSLLQRGS